MSLSELERLSGVNRGSISRYENGFQACTIDSFERIMAALEAAQSGAGWPRDASGDAANLTPPGEGESPASSPLDLPAPVHIE